MSGPSLLVVDDQVIAAESLRAILGGLGHPDVRVALSGSEAMRAVAERLPSLILMDVNLGEGDDGIVLADRITSAHDVPVVFVTAYTDPPTLARAKATRPFGYLVKPINQRDVQVVVEIALHNHDLDRRLRQSERDLRRATERLDVALRATGAAIWEWTVPTGETVFGERWASMVGYTLAELEPVSIATWARLCHPDDLQRSDEAIARCFARETETYDCECRLRHKDGRWIWVLDIGRVVEWKADGTPLRMVGAHIDITQHKERAESHLELERRLLRAQKLDSLGLLSGGVAHRFNNLLTSVIGNTDLALMQVGTNSPALESLREIRASAQEGAELSGLMLAYTGRQRVVTAMVELGTLVRETVPLLEAALPVTTSLVVDLEPDVPAIRADAAQIRQVLTSLVTNASEAIGSSTGIVTVRVGTAECTRDQIDRMHAPEDAHPGRHVYLEVADTGEGMRPETVAQMFDPFFSTKFTGRGLGLAAVRGIVRSHRGAMDLHTARGAGTTFRVWLPVGDTPPEAPAP